MHEPALVQPMVRVALPKVAVAEVIALPVGGLAMVAVIATGEAQERTLVGEEAVRVIEDSGRQAWLASQ